MEGRFSESVLKRLPASVRRLDTSHQEVYIYLRVRKSPEEISRTMGLSPERVEAMVAKIRHELARSGELHLIEPPRLLPVHSHNPDTPGIQLSSGGLSVEKIAILKQFITHLRDTIESLPPQQVRLLRLRYNHGMSAKEILGFSKRMNLCLVPEKPLSELSEQDIFYALTQALKAVLRGLKARYGDEYRLCPDSLKAILEEVEI